MNSPFDEFDPNRDYDQTIICKTVEKRIIKEKDSEVEAAELPSTDEQVVPSQYTTIPSPFLFC
jgi:hypothetical protein